MLTTDANGGVSITDYSGSYAVIGDCQALANKPPMCALSASNTKVAKGSTVTLFAKCTSPTDSVTWNAPVGSPALTPLSTFAKTVTLPNAGAYTYTIKGTSTYGTGGPSSPVTILVGNDAAAGSEDKPNCVLTVSPASVEITQSATLSVVCQPEATSYAWDAADANAPASPSSSTALADLAFANVGTYTYKVAGNGTPGTGPKASATITVGTGVNFVNYSNRGPGTGSLNFPTGVQSTDWLALYTVSNGDLATPSGWTNAAKRALTNYPGSYVNLFVRQAGADTSVASVPANAIIVAYRGGTGFGTAATFFESAPSGSNCQMTATRTTAGGAIVSFYSDADSTFGIPPVLRTVCLGALG